MGLRASLPCALLVLCACGAKPIQNQKAATVVRTAPIDPLRDGYFDSVWPDDRRLDADGWFPGTDFPNPRPGGFFDNVILHSGHLVKGWSVAAPVFVPFSGPIDAASLPADPGASTDADASVFLVALDPGSPAYGQRVPLEWELFEEPTLWLPGHVLAIRPVRGWVLRSNTRYALIVTNKVRDARGLALGPDEAFAGGLASDPFYQPLAAFLSDQHIPTDSISGAALFTTQSTVTELLGLRDWAERIDAPTIQTLKASDPQPNAHVLVGTYGPTPWLLHGEKPYEQGGGEIRYGSDGRPIVAETETMRIALCLPKGPVPEQGFPVVFTSHGTGGDYRSFIRKANCEQLAREGIASVGIDQVLTGPRAPAKATCLGQPAEDCFLNVANPVSARNLIRHTVLDHIFLRRLFETLSIGAELDPEGRTVRFDLTHFGFFGHSQGGLTGALYAAVEQNLAGALLSGTGGHITTTLLQRKDPPINSLLSGPLYFDIAGVEELNQFHPALAYLQTLADVTDPLSYAQHWSKAPYGRPKNIFLTSGIEDAYTPPETASTLAIAGGLPQLVDGAQPDLRWTLAGLAPVAGPVRANIAASPAVTGLLRQFPGADHFPIYTDMTAVAQERAFFKSLLSTGTATIPPP